LIGLGSAALLVLLPVTNEGLLIPVMIGIGLCAVGWNGVFLALLTEIVPPKLIGSTSGVAMLLVHVGAVIMPPIVGVVAALSGGWLLAWGLCGATTLLSVVVLHFGRIPSVLAVEGRPIVA
jgi:hypothetical protein